MKGIIRLIIIVLFFSSGCAWFETKEEKSADTLISDAMQSFEKEKYRDAIESFRKLKEWYPFSQFAILAELKTADAYYHLKEYAEATAGYETFESLHPRNEAIPYVIYQIGLCYFNQMDTIDRDQSATQKALETFNRLIKLYPREQLAVKAKDHIMNCQKNLAEHELYVGVFYYRSNYYKTALSRFGSVLSEYPDIDNIHAKAKHYIELCEESLKKNKMASKAESQNDSDL